MTKPSLSPATVEAAVVAALGPVEDFAPITEGRQSQAFGCRRADRQLVVRVNRGTAGFHKDRWAANRLETVVPVPEVLHIGRIDDDHHFCVTERLPGTIVQDHDETALQTLAGPVAATLGAIAAVDVGDIAGFGDFDPVTGTARCDSWAAHVGHSARHDWDEHAGALDVATARRLTDWLRAAAARLPDVHELVHGDFGGDNVLVESGRVSAVLDWEAAVIGDRWYDVARMLFWAPFIASMRVHADHLLAEPHDEQRLRCYVVAQGLDATAYFAAAGQHPIAQAMLERTARDPDDQRPTSAMSLR